MGTRSKHHHARRTVSTSRGARHPARLSARQFPSYQPGTRVKASDRIYRVGNNGEWRMVAMVGNQDR
jgi:hypothetical protein